MSSEARGIGVGQLRAAARHYLPLAASGTPIPVMRRNKIVAEIQSLDQRAAEFSRRRSVAAVTVIQMGSMGAMASHCLDMVAAGEIVEVVEGDRPVARIVPYEGDAAQDDEPRSSRHRIVGRDYRFGPTRVTESLRNATDEVAVGETSVDSGSVSVCLNDGHVEHKANPGLSPEAVQELCKPRRALGRGMRRRGRYLVCDRCGKCGPVRDFTLSEFGWECCVTDDLDVMGIGHSAIC